MELTNNFDSEEFKCKDGTEVPEKYIVNLQELAENLQTLRDYIGKPVSVTGSGYRTREWNDSIKGAAKNSQHLTASAADINAKGYEPKELFVVIEALIRDGKMKQGGLSLYPGFVHYDIRGYKARW